ncbi:MAG: MoxR family ATPase [Planctomycetota bacterium]|nr:MoxR family ATPase [Planctomycetota bacterium]
MATAIAAEIGAAIHRLQNNMHTVVKGKQQAVKMCVVAMVAGEHILLEDVPGVGKTLIGKALSRSIDVEFCRLQFTPDLLPSDILGSSVFRPSTAEFEFVQGPIFNSVVLADEINRAPPRTQSALLEAMSDEQVSVDGVTHPLPDPFMVIATQNPFEFEGTYILPESQMDRFLLRISLGYPERKEELDVLQSHREGDPIESLKPVLTGGEVKRLKDAARQVHVDDSISHYILDVVERTRQSDELKVGVSTRGALLWYRAAQALALVEGVNFVTPDHVKSLAIPVLSHRVTASGFSQGSKKNEMESIVARLMEDISVPS